MKTMKIGIATQEEMRARTLAIAKGELKPKSTDPTVWFESMASAAQVLSDENRLRGEVLGVVVGAPRGDGGFGYDPIVAPVEADGRTFAEMSVAEKHAISHRARAFTQLARIL